MKKNENNFKISIFILNITFVILLMGIMFHLGDIRIALETIREEQRATQSYEATYYEELDSIIELLNEKEAVVDSCKVKLKDIDGDALTGEYKVEILLKEFSDDTKVAIQIGKFSETLKQEDKKFTGTIEIPIKDSHDEYDEYVIFVENKGVTKTYKKLFEDEDEEDWITGIGGQFEACLNVDEYQENKELSLHISDMWYEISKIEKGDNKPVLYVKRNNNIIYEKEIDSSTDSMLIDEGWNIEDGVYCIGIKYQGKSGICYDCILHEISKEGKTTYEDAKTIYDKNGNQIYIQGYE